MADFQILPAASLRRHASNLKAQWTVNGCEEKLRFSDLNKRTDMWRNMTSCTDDHCVTTRSEWILMKSKMYLCNYKTTIWWMISHNDGGNASTCTSTRNPQDSWIGRNCKKDHKATCTSVSQTTTCMLKPMFSSLSKRSSDFYSFYNTCWCHLSKFLQGWMSQNYKNRYTLCMFSATSHLFDAPLEILFG